jgi:hypothetical protein
VAHRFVRAGSGQSGGGARPLAHRAVDLLVSFVVLQVRGKHPLLPRRVDRDRDRGASFGSMVIAGSGSFGVFLFLARGRRRRGMRLVERRRWRVKRLRTLVRDNRSERWLSHAVSRRVHEITLVSGASLLLI